MNKLVISKEGFGEILLDLIKSGVGFEAYEDVSNKTGEITIKFTGSY